MTEGHHLVRYLIDGFSHIALNIWTAKQGKSTIYSRVFTLKPPFSSETYHIFLCSFPHIVSIFAHGWGIHHRFFRVKLPSGQTRQLLKEASQLFHQEIEDMEGIVPGHQPWPYGGFHTGIPQVTIGVSILSFGLVTWMIWGIPIYGKSIMSQMMKLTSS